MIHEDAPTLMMDEDQTDLLMIQQRLEGLFQAAQGGVAGAARTALLHGGAAGRQQVYAAFAEAVQAQPGRLIRINCHQPALVSFLSLRPLLDQVVPIVFDEARQLLETHAAELHAIYPDLSQRYGIRPALTLDQIALTPSERRSHRESEQAFRVIMALCTLLIQAQQRCPSLAGGPLVLWWDNLQAADRPTLLTFRRLNHWISQARLPLFLVGTWLSASGPALAETSLAPEIDRYCDWRGEHRQMFETVLAQLDAVALALPDDTTVQPLVPQPVTVEQPGVDSSSSLGESEAMLLALSHFQRDAIEEGCAYALHAMRLAIFNLNLEAILLLGQRINATLAPGATATFDAERFQQRWQQLTAHDRYVALEFSVANMREPRDILFATWKAIALAHTFLEHHATAVECYQIALDYAAEPHQRAQICMYLGLITGKRLRQIDQARDFLRQGFEAIGDLDDPDSSLERGWLLNVSALMAYQSRSFNEAMKYVQEARTRMKPFHHSEAAHLKINLISNISVLLEDGKRLDDALKTWTYFRTFLGSANEIFTKHYFFREGGLRFKTGDLTGALENYQQSYAQAKEINDPFHMDIAARACGYLCYRLGQFDAAQEWYSISVQLREQIGDYANLPDSLLAEALCTQRAGDQPAAQHAVQQAGQLSRDLGLPRQELVSQVADELAQPSAELLAAWEQSVIQAPSTKLNRPFYLINLYNGKPE